MLVGGCVLTPQGGCPPLKSTFSFAFPPTSRGPNSIAFHSFLLDYVFIFLIALLCRSSVASFQLLFTESCSSCSLFFCFLFFVFCRWRWSSHPLTSFWNRNWNLLILWQKKLKNPFFNNKKNDCHGVLFLSKEVQWNEKY